MDVIRDINRLKQERNAVILAHNYQPPEVKAECDMCCTSEREKET